LPAGFVSRPCTSSIGETRRSCVRIAPAPHFLARGDGYKYRGVKITNGARNMYQDVVTKCWSIREVNRNLIDREATSDLSINYLTKACEELADLLRSGSNSKMKIEVIDKNGKKRKFTQAEVAEMLGDVKKIFELNLIDCIDRWARSKNS
jgi:hypothetical protein